ncbi:MAG: hypothetical protein HC915_14050 [Anaerolineae bacterium]|nr:hypothetical protein [Anaerolineae bacterium]
MLWGSCGGGQHGKGWFFFPWAFFPLMFLLFWLGKLFFAVLGSIGAALGSVPWLELSLAMVPVFLLGVFVVGLLALIPLGALAWRTWNAPQRKRKNDQSGRYEDYFDVEGRQYYVKNEAGEFVPVRRA